MKSLLLLIALTLALYGQSAEAAECSSFVADDSTRPTDDAEFAGQLAATALNAEQAGCLSEADRLLEGAHRLDPRPRLIYQRILVREAMEDFDYAHTLLEAYRLELAGDPSIDDLVDVDARLRARLRDDPPEIVPPSGPVPERRSTFDTVGPLVLAGVGAVSLGLAVYGLTAKCDTPATDGTCLRGSEVRLGPTLGYSATGVVGLTAAAVWWIIAIPRPDSAMPEARVSLSATGVSVQF